MKSSIKYATIFSNKDKHSVSYMCKFFDVSRSGYYDWIKQKDIPDKDDMIADLIRTCQKQTNQTYGYRRVKIWLLREVGLVINHKSVLRIMRKYVLLSVIRRPRPLYQRQKSFKVYEDKLKRDFRAEKPNQKWVTDISYIHTKQGVLYLSMIKDLYDNFIVSYDTGTVQDNSLVYRTVKKAKKKVADELILHSDQGFQYTSHGYMKLAKEYSILPSMSRAGTPLDNAPAEQFFGVLKTECIYRHKIQTFDEARKLISDYIHFYNLNVFKQKRSLLLTKQGVNLRNI